jgi:glycosyl-4,4'-diaponeurosporenoate acyltransferase
VPIELPIAWIIVLNVAAWPVIQFGLAWAFTRMPAAWFEPGAARPREPRGWFYERIFGIKRWKDRLPDAARWFGGGFAKGALANTEPDYLRRFIRETWRGELCHWAALAWAPVFFLWNPWWADLVIAAYALAANLPCILVQRYNRLRFRRLLVRDLRRAGFALARPPCNTSPHLS